MGVEFIVIRLNSIDSWRIGPCRVELFHRKSIRKMHVPGGVNWLRFESIRTIRHKLSVSKSNRNTGNLFALGNNAVRTTGS